MYNYTIKQHGILGTSLKPDWECDFDSYYFEDKMPVETQHI